MPVIAAVLADVLHLLIALGVYVESKKTQRRTEKTKDPRCHFIMPVRSLCRQTLRS